MCNKQHEPLQKGSLNAVMMESKECGSLVEMAMRFNVKCGFSHPWRHHFATNTKAKLQEMPVKILYGLQGGTARIFAIQLSEALESVVPGKEVTIQGFHNKSPAKLLQPGQNLHVLTSSMSGVGQPPVNARDFYNWLTTQGHQQDAGTWLEGVDFCVFELGYQKAHPNQYNVIGKVVDEKLARSQQDP